MFSVGKEGRVKLQATAVSKAAGENREERLEFVWILTNLGLPLNVESDMVRGFLKN